MNKIHQLRSTGNSRFRWQIARAGSFGVGTWLTNDFEKSSWYEGKSKVLNTVVKLESIDGKECVKRLQRIREFQK
ncbi:hypothetical protein DFJ58DRAFT_33356 [Suillus subalutaceus]|uniref:uncharacterized protein n=1 Tax=Suillus subalutaceus TaxID=48586 RepID=UPI001B885CCE|nr:uncharacterized protein DFJ58DRAFT_33356 [Suillus subalutaceus]KAG1843917.1 hypothetical protein DFJ58DRAFT_33356 [Suillus subalutaceus]